MKSFSAKVLDLQDTFQFKFSKVFSTKGYKKILAQIYFDAASGATYTIQGTSKVDGSGTPTGWVDIGSDTTPTPGWTYLKSIPTCYDYCRVAISNNAGAFPYYAKAFVLVQDEN